MEMISYMTLTYLLNALWQVTLITAVAAFSISLLKNIASRYRHILWVMTLVLCFALPVVSLYQFSSGDLKPPSLSNEKWEPSELDQTNVTQVGPPWMSNFRVTSDASVRLALPLTTFLASLYGLFFFYRLKKLWQGWKATRRIQHYSYPVVISESILSIIERCQTTLGVTKSSVLCSPEIIEPLTVGFSDPKIILPEPLFKKGPPAALMAALGHEMAHIRRRDFALNILYELLYLPISFHPAAALVKRRISETRELACDESVTDQLMDTHSYARSLVGFASLVSSTGRHAFTLGVTDANILEERVMKLLRSRPHISRRLTTLSVILVSLVLATVALGAANFSVNIEQQQASAAQDPGSLFVGTWKGKRNPDDIAEYVVRFTMDGGKLAGEALDVGKRQDLDRDKNLKPAKKVRENYVKLQNLSVNGTTLSFRLKDGKGRSQDVTMKLVNDSEALVEFVAERRFPDAPTTTEGISIRLTKQ